MPQTQNLFALLPDQNELIRRLGKEGLSNLLANSSTIDNLTQELANNPEFVNTVSTIGSVMLSNPAMFLNGILHLILAGANSVPQNTLRGNVTQAPATEVIQ